MKKTLAILIAVLLVFGSFCGAFAGSVSVTERKEKPKPLKEVYSGTCGANLTWTLDSETGVLEITGTGDMTDWSFGSGPWSSYGPSIITIVIGDQVTSIGRFAFCNCDALTSVTIGSGVTSIGNFAFFNCDSLASVTIGNGVISIGEEAFSECGSLTTVTIPRSVMSMGYHAFGSCGSLVCATFCGAVPDYYGSAPFGAVDFFGETQSFVIYYYPEYAYSWSPNGETEWEGYPIVELVQTPPEEFPGDLDGDGVISMSDVTTLSMFLNGENPQISSSGLQAADANGDGTVDIRDIAAIYQKIAQS